MLVLSILIVLAGCGPAEDPAASATTGASRPAAEWDHFGAALSDGASPVSIAQLLANPEAYEGKTVSIEGTADAVCKVKGCWMEMNGAGKTMRVTFKDYGFFVPVDSQGRVTRAEGVFSLKTVPEAEARHLLEDAGKSAEAAALKGDQKEYRLIATGVAMKPAAKQKGG